MFNFFDSLQNVALDANPVKEKASKLSIPRVEKNPTNGADFRIMATGKIYPSQQFVDDFSLEYTPKDSNVISNGFDLFPSNQWGNYKNGPDLLMGYAVRMDSPKVELFSGVRYKEDGTAINSVMEQGTTLGDDTLELIASALGSVESDGGNTSAWHNLLVQLATGEEGIARYVDFYVVRNVGAALTMPDGIYNIPKMIVRGEKKGQLTTVRREKVNVLPVVIFTEEVKAQFQANSTTTEHVEGEFTEKVLDGEEVEAHELTATKSLEITTENTEKMAA